MRAFQPAKSGHALVSVGARSAVPSPFLAAAYLGGPIGEVISILAIPMTKIQLLARLKIAEHMTTCGVILINTGIESQPLPAFLLLLM